MLISSVVSMGIGMVINIFVARTLGPEVKGRIDLLNASGALMSMVVGLSLASGITFVVAQGPLDRRRLVWQLVSIALVQGWVVWLSLAILSRTRFANAFIPPDYTTWGAIGVSIMTFAGLLSGYGRAFLSGLQKFVVGAVLDIVARILTAAATLGALFWAGADHDRAAVAVIVGTIAANYMVVFVTIVMLGPRLDHHGPASGFRRVWQYSLPSYGANLVQFANYRLDVFLVAYFVGVREVALYVVAVSVAQLLWLPSNAMQSVLFPRLSSMTDDYRRAEEAAQIMRLMLTLTILAGGAFALVTPWVITLLFGVRFVPSVLPLWILLPGIVVFCIANILCGYLAAIGKPQLNLLVSLSGLMATLLIDFALIPTLGIVGAAIASSVSYSISAGLALCFFLRESSLSLGRSLWLTMGDVQFGICALRRVWQQAFSRT